MDPGENPMAIMGLGRNFFFPLWGKIPKWFNWASGFLYSVKILKQALQVICYGGNPIPPYSSINLPNYTIIMELKTHIISRK